MLLSKIITRKNGAKCPKSQRSNTVVVAYINTMKTTFDYDLYQPVIQHGYT